MPLSTLAGGISSGLATDPSFKGAGLDKLLLRSTVGNVLTQGVGVVTGLQSSFSWRGVAASAAGAVAGHVAGKLLGDVVDTASWDPWAKEMVTRTGAGLAAGTVASIAQGGRVSMQQVATDAFGNALGWSVAGTSGVLPPSPVATSKYPWLTEMNQWSSLPRVKVAELGSDFSPTVLDSASPSYALPTLVVRPSGSEWSNPFADSGLASVQWTISSITNAARSSPQEANWSFREASMAQRKLDDAQALVQYRARLANGPSMSAWDGVVRQSPIDTYLTQARGGLDAVRGEQWGMRVAQSLPDAVVNEAGGLAAAKAIGMLGKVAAPVRGAIFGERSVLMSNLQTEMRAGLRVDLPIGPSLEGIRPGGSAAVFGSTGRTGTADYLSRFI